MNNCAAPNTLTEYFVVYNKEYARILFIVDQVRRHKQTKILCFTNTRDSASRLNQLLNEFVGIRSAYLSCLQRVSDFEEGDLDVLVTADSMVVGMDIEGVKCVIQYDLTHEVHTHIDRVGYTARAGTIGHAYTLCYKKEVCALFS
jgi:superfamily II DNA/RNA helicase